MTLKDGKYVSGTYEIDGKFYQFDDNGVATAVEFYTKDEIDALISGINDRLDALESSLSGGVE